jgi:arylsulfatase A-like enzyme
MINKKFVSIFALAASLFTSAAAEKKSPNVLFIAVDDLNDWIGCMGGHPQSRTPNFDRLADSGLLFTNAHCIAPACNPSRSALFTGRAPNKTGMYNNGQKMREVMPKESLLPRYFSDHGYWSSGSGKMLHYFIDAQSWDEYFPKKETENPFPKTYNPPNRPLSLPKAGPWQYTETDWGPVNVSDKEYGGDYSVAEYVGKQLSKKHDKPFFLACGIYHPHEPWFAPQKYFDQYPLEDIQLTIGYKKGDLDDLPASGKKMGRNRYFAHIQKQKQWKQGIQGYLASIAFADAMLGRVLDALENGPNKDNTIVVLWSDHGWHLGEKEHWQKFSGWRVSTRVPLMVKIPKGVSKALPDGVAAGGRCDEPVSLLSLFPTLTELCGLPAKAGIDGKSLLPLLKDPEMKTGQVAVTYLGTAGSYATSGKDWRYIHYADGGEELYHIQSDPFEWKNLAANPEYKQKLIEFRNRSPKDFKPKVEPSYKSLIALKWVPLSGTKPPSSKPDGSKRKIAFMNRKKEAVILNHVSVTGEVKEIGKIAPGKNRIAHGAPGSVWVIADLKGTLLGHFSVVDRAAKAVIK